MLDFEEDSVSEESSPLLRDEARRLLTKARNSWLIPLLTWVGTIVFGMIPLTYYLPEAIFHLFGIARILVLFWGFCRGLRMFMKYKGIAKVRRHGLGGLILCGAPLLLGFLLLEYLMVLPQNQDPFWIIE